MTIRLSLAAALLAATTGLAMAQSAPEPRDPNAAPAHKPAAPQHPMARTPGRPGPHGMMGPHGKMGPDGMMSPHRHLPAGHPPIMGYGMMQIHAGMGDGDFALTGLDHLEGRIAFLKAEIGITEAQTPQWTAFAEALRAGVTAMRAAIAGCATDSGARSAPDQAEAMVQRMSTQLDSLKTTLAAERPLYAVLTDEQKRSADQLLAGSGMGMSMGMGGMMMGRAP